MVPARRHFGLLSETCSAVDLVPARLDYFHESALYQLLIFPIPRAVWPGKPVSSVARYYTLERWGIDVLDFAGNTFPGIVGQYYMSWGWGGAAWLGILLGAMAVVGQGALNRAEKIQADAFKLCAYMFGTWIFVTFRFLSGGLLVPVLAAFGIAWLGSRWSARRARRAPAGRPPHE